MNIALLTQYYKPEMGAPQNRLYEMMTGLKKAGNNVYVITGMPNYPTGKIFDNYRSKFSILENLDDIIVKRYWLFASNSKQKLPRIWNMFSFSMVSLFSLLFLKRNKIDCLIVESPPLTLGLTGYVLSKMIGAQLVCNISDLWPLSAKELGAINDGFIYNILEKIEIFLYEKSLFCMGQSAEIVEHIKNKGARSVYLFRNGVDPLRFNPKTNFRESDSIPLKIGYAGLLGYAQGIYDICENINFSEINAEFHIYGEGGEKNKIEAYAKNNPNKGLFYHGVVTRNEIPTILIGLDATLIPLVKNIFGAVPSKIYESMAAGVPIIFSGEGEGEKIIVENDLGWVLKAKDYNKLISIIKCISDSKLEVKKKSQNCIECANNKFNRPKQVEDLNDYLKLMLKKV